MKHSSFLFLTAATALAFAGASTAVAQRPAGLTDEVITILDREATEVRDEAKAGEKTPATVPLAEAKKRYQQSERRLRDLAEGKSDLIRHDVELAYPVPARFEVSVVDRRDQVRQAVAEAYDARQHLQAAELAELERRIAGIKRAMALRETMKDSIIDQRTDELLEQMEATENQPKQQQQGGAPQPNKSGSQSQTPGYPSPAGNSTVDPFGATVENAKDPHLASETERRLLELDVQEAEATLAAALRAQRRGKALFDTGTMGEDEYDKLSEEVKRAKIQCERAKVKLKAVSARPSAETKPAPTTTREVEVRIPVIVDGRQETRIKRIQVTEEGNPAAAEPSNGTSGESTTDAGESAAERAAPDEPRNQAQTLDNPGASKGITEKRSDGESETARQQRLHREHQKKILAIDVEDAQAHLESAERAYKRFEELRATGAIEEGIFDEQAERYKQSQIKLKRAKVTLDSFIKAHEPVRGVATNPPAVGDAAEMEQKQRLAALDVEAAEANLAEAEIRYERCKRLYDSNSIQKSHLDRQADGYKRAQKQLERAKVKLNALSPASTSAFDPTQGKQVATANTKNPLTITLVETGDGKPAAVYLADGKVGDPLTGTPDEQDDRIRHAVEEGVGAGEPSVLIKAEKGVAHRDVLRVSEAAGSVEGVSLRLSVAEKGTGRE